MTQEEKELLLKDLCARLPYGVKVLVSSSHTTDPIRKKLNANLLFGLQKSVLTIKPYLRPMSSMTEEEKEKLQLLHDIICNENYGDGYSPAAWDAITEWEGYCNLRHLDYRGLISMGLALEASKEMYKN